MSGWRNRALSSKLSLQSSASTSPPAVTISGLISASEASVSMNSLTKFLKNVAPFLAVSPVRPSALQIFRAWKSARPSPTSIGTRRIFSGVLWATVSISTPPSVEAIRTGHCKAAVDRHSQVELAGDVVSDRHQHLGDRASLRTGLVGHQRLAQQAGGGSFAPPGPT